MIIQNSRFRMRVFRTRGSGEPVRCKFGAMMGFFGGTIGCFVHVEV